MRETFSVLSYNIQAGIGTQRAHHYLTRAHHQLVSTKSKRTRLRAIGKFLAGFDVVCLQEVDPGGRRAGFVNQGELLRQASGHDHHVFQENRTVRAISRHGNAILSRVPIIRCEDLKLPGRIGGRGALLVELDMEPATLIACVHLSLGPEDQTEQLDYLAGAMTRPEFGRARKVVCGDMNCAAQSSPLSRFTERTGIRPITGASHRTYPAWAPRLGLDHILTDDGAHKHEVTVEAANFSDHLPVSALFSAATIRS